MLPEFDLFELWRLIVFVFLAAYHAASVASLLIQTRRLVQSPRPEAQVVSAYVMWLILSVRLRSLSDEWLRLGAWLALLIGLWWLHGVL